MKINYFIRRPFQLLVALITRLPYFSFIRGTAKYQNKANFEMWFLQKLLNLGGNKNAYWPVHPTSQVFDSGRIYAGVDTCPGLMKGCYIQGRGGIWFGDYTQVGPNVVVVSANHDVHDLRKHIEKPVWIGNYCWLGASSTILPGVELGEFTIVGAGAVVTKSFPDGFVVIGGNPAKVIRKITPVQCLRYELRDKFHGYLPEKQFRKFRSHYLEIDKIFSSKLRSK
jgi:acetyltransferase-like isoleucine patch superfamily enzyme